MSDELADHRTVSSPMQTTTVDPQAEGRSEAFETMISDRTLFSFFDLVNRLATTFFVSMDMSKSFP